MTKTIAVVTGANKGIGLAIVEALLRRLEDRGVVYLTSRDETRGKQAVDKLRTLGLYPAYHQLDVSDRLSVTRLRDHLRDTHGHINLLVNNAAIANSVELYNSYEESKEIIDINYRSILVIQELLYPLVRDGGRILNISSDCGHLSNVRNEYWVQRLKSKDLTVSDINEFVDWYLDGVKRETFNFEEIADRGTLAAYRVAKVALSAITNLQAKELAQRGVAVNSMHPGLVRTDMTNGVGFLSAQEAAATPIHLLLDAPQTLTGAYVWFDLRQLDWSDHTADYYFKSSTLQSS